MGLLYSKPLEIFNLDWSTEWSPTPKPCPLFRLPFFALLEVFKSLDPIELFILSQCSRKAANCVHIVGSKKWKLTVYVGSKCIKINNKYRLFIIETTQKSWRYDKNLDTWSLEYQSIGNSKLELQYVISKVQAAFKCPVTSFEYNSVNKESQCWLPVLKYIIQHQVQPLESLYISGTVKNKELDWALQNVRVTQKIYINLHNMPNFSSDFQPICEQFTFVSSFSHILSLDLMKLKSCKYIRLTLALTMHDLDVFMKEWKAGGFPNLQYMLIVRNRVRSTGQILGFGKHSLNVRRGVTRRLEIDENLSVECTGGRDIRAANGTWATMQMERVFSDSFELFVWDN